MKKCLLVLAVFAGFFFSCEQDVTDDSYAVKVDFSGKTGLSWKYVYVCWLEDADGKNIQNLYVCENALPPDTKGLLGHGLPVWSRPNDGAYYKHTDIDGVSGATQDGNVSIQSTLKNQNIRKFRVCFEIDRSKNDNTYFSDRPAFLYKSELIDLDNLDPSYNLTLRGWMINDTLSGDYSQAPKDIKEFPFFDNEADCPFEFRTELDFIQPVDDMVNSLTATVIAE